MSSPSDIDMEPKPPDNGPQPTVKASFRDTLLGNKDTDLDKMKLPSESMELANSDHPQKELHAGNLGNQNKDAKPPQAPVNSMEKQDAHGSQISNQIVFQSKALSQSQSPNARKKRHRTEPPAKDVSSSGSQPLLTLPKAKNLSVEDANTFSFHPHGIKTMMNVEVLSSNRMRFRDEDDPVGSPSSKSIMEGQAMDSKDQGMDHNPDVVMEAASVPNQ
ncbi:hypothetical protein SESBI_17207 [Sesbania bispinosa]|nr:hypothetical protein SESBI_17207 [Sesbania bispinosa]